MSAYWSERWQVGLPLMPDCAAGCHFLTAHAFLECNNVEGSGRSQVSQEVQQG